MMTLEQDGRRNGGVAGRAACSRITKISLLPPLYAKKRRGVWGKPRAVDQRQKRIAYLPSTDASEFHAEGSNTGAPRSINLLLSTPISDSRDIVKFNLCCANCFVSFPFPFDV